MAIEQKRSHADLLLLGVMTSSSKLRSISTQVLYECKYLSKLLLPNSCAVVTTGTKTLINNTILSNQVQY